MLMAVLADKSRKVRLIALFASVLAIGVGLLILR